jgi:hypothetical protein
LRDGPIFGFAIRPYEELPVRLVKDQVRRNFSLFNKPTKAILGMSLVALCCTGFPGTHLITLQAQTARPSPETDTVDVVKAVRNAGQQVVFQDFQRWCGSRAAFDAVRDFLQVEPVLGTDWRNAVDVVAIVAGGDPDLGEKALQELRTFAQDTHYFSSADKLPGAPVISEAAAAAKMEVPFAIAFLAGAAALHQSFHPTSVEQAKRLHAIHWQATQLLYEAQSPAFWKVEWANAAYSGDSEEGYARRSKLLAKRSSEALARLPQPH